MGHPDNNGNLKIALALICLYPLGSALSFVVITFGLIYLYWDFQLIALNAIVTVLFIGVYLCTTMSERKL